MNPRIAVIFAVALLHVAATSFVPYRPMEPVSAMFALGSSRYIVPRVMRTSPSRDMSGSYTLYVNVDDAADVYLNGNPIGSTTKYTVSLVIPVVLYPLDVLAFSATDIGTKSGIWWAADPGTSGGEVLHSGNSGSVGIQAADYTGASGEWTTQAYDACQWPAAVAATSTKAFGGFPPDLGATPIWAAGKQTKTDVYVRNTFGGGCNACACSEGDGCNNGVCSNCLYYFTDPAGTARTACYDGWSVQDCGRYGPDYHWCGN
uniref:Sex specific lectin n=1 Tax=Aglaothamnion oosumiense TaxID=1218750 RepID=J7H7H6_9FLOR|nr:sex specific lectin [Aglaothamnion oosumiense]